MSTGFKDPDGEFPRSEYVGNPTTNKASREEWEPYVKLPDGTENLELVPIDWQPKYPYNKVEETSSGHRIETDDTPGEERLSFVHKDGSGIEMYPNTQDATTFLLNSVGRQVQLVGDDFVMIVNGNGDVHYKGNLNLNVDGDFNIACTNFTVTTTGKHIEEISQGKVENFVGDRVVTTQGSKSEVVLGNYTVESMGNSYFVSKKNTRITAEDNIDIFAGDDMRLTAEGAMTSSAMTNRLIGLCTSVVGNTGTFGGDNIVMYSKSLHTDTVNATTTRSSFVGDLKGDVEGNLQGNADTATQAGRAGTAAATGAGGSGGTPANPNVTEIPPTTTAEPTLENLSEGLTRTQTLGIRNIDVDDGRISGSVKSEVQSSGSSSNTAQRPDTFGDDESGLSPELFQQSLAEQRARFAAELESNSALRERVQALALAEFGSNPGAIMETMMNRAAAEGKTLSEIVTDSRYYAPYKNGAYEKSLRTLRGSIGLQSSTSQALQNALNGSNITNLATHAASGRFGIQSYISGTLTQTLVEGSSSEYFYRKDRKYAGIGIDHGTGATDKAWYDNIVGSIR